MPISELHRTWLNDIYDRRFEDGCLNSLLSLTSHSEEGSGEPRWLVFCDYLAKAMVNRSAELGAGEIERQLHTWAMQLWGPGRLTREDLAWEWFGERSPNEIIDRALAVASLVGQHHDRSLAPLFANTLSDQLLSPPEQAALIDYLVERHGPRDQVRVPVMLVNAGEPPGEQGRRTQLRLTLIRVTPNQHGKLFRAPAALLLSLSAGADTSFEDGLRKVEFLLAGCLTPPEADQGWGLLWSLHPEPMVLDRHDLRKPFDWFMHSITGASATGAFALAGLWVLREQLYETVGGMTLARQQLRDIHPAQIVISARLEGDEPPDPCRPLDWSLDRVHGLDEKLGSFVRDQALMSGNESHVSLALVSHNQAYRGDLIRPEPAKSIADVLDIAHRKIGGVLPTAGEALRRFLLDVNFEQSFDVEGRVIDDAQPRTPLAPLELIAPLRSDSQRSNLQALAGPINLKDIGKPNAIAWYLLRCYSRWAGGDHMVWGEPARLTEDFFPIRLETKKYKKEDQLRTGGKQAAKKVTARSLIELLDPGFLPRQPAVWVLAAAPAAGKTTMMAEFQMYHAFRGLRQYALSGHFGVVPIWIPARELVLGDPMSVHERTLDQAIEAWLQCNWPALGSMHSLLGSSFARIQVLLDGVNELRCPVEKRERLLNDWLAANYGLAHSHRSPMLTVRSLELIRPQGAQLATLQAWNRGQRDAYVRQRMEAHQRYLEAMQSSLEVDERMSGGDPQKMLYGSPGMLSLACTLMLKGLLPTDPEQSHMKRARLLSTLIWSRLEAEDQNHSGNIPTKLLGPEEKKRLRDLEGRLKKGDWGLPEKPGRLLSALAEQARRMQFDHAVAEIELPEAEWWTDTGEEGQRTALTKAACHLGVVELRRALDSRGRICDLLGFRHQLLLEFLAVFGLLPDERLPEGVKSPVMRSIEIDYAEWARINQYDPEINELNYGFKLPSPGISSLEESIKLAAQLRGNTVEWVTKLVEVENVPLAARVALQDLGAFGEPLYPSEDPQGPWRMEKGLGRPTGTHPVLNILRNKLHERMFDSKVHISQRIESGRLLGEIGGSPLFRICGSGLILREEYWMSIGESGKFFDFNMVRWPANYLSKGRKRFKNVKVRDLGAFKMASFMVVNAQYRCFAQSKEYGDPKWWPTKILGKLDAKKYHIPKSLRGKKQAGNGLEPLICSYFQAQAYAEWESIQRLSEGIASCSVRLPTEVQWEAGARWPMIFSGQSYRKWFFPYAKGAGCRGVVEKYEFDGINRWDFNHHGILGDDGWFSPVGVFLNSHVWHSDHLLADLSGNGFEWCSSRWSEKLGSEALRAGFGYCSRVIRSSHPFLPDGDSGVGCRHGQNPNDQSGMGVGCRLIMT